MINIWKRFQRLSPFFPQENIILLFYFVLVGLLFFILHQTLAPVIVYVAGTLGTLIGSDLLNIKKIQRLGAPVASIGGTGTFDGVFFIRNYSCIADFF